MRSFIKKYLFDICSFMLYVALVTLYHRYRSGPGYNSADFYLTLVVGLVIVTVMRLRRQRKKVNIKTQSGQ